MEADICRLILYMQDSRVDVMRLRNVVKAIVFMVILCGLLVITEFMMKGYKEPHNFIVSNTSTNRIKNEPENSIDVLFVGDSINQAAFVPYEIWENYGITSFVCGSSGQYLYESYDYLKKVFEMQDPKVVVLETDNFHRYATLEQYTMVRLSEDFTLINNHDKWKRSLDKVFPNARDIDTYAGIDEIDVFKGYVYTPSVVPYTGRSDYMNNSSYKEEISISNRIIIKGIQKLCKENGAALIFVGAPSPLNSTNGKHRAIEELANAMGVTFLDYNLGELNEELMLDWDVDTRDAGDHLSHAAAKKISNSIGAYLSEVYGLEDRRNQPEYTWWNDGLNTYHILIPE